MSWYHVQLGQCCWIDIVEAAWRLTGLMLGGCLPAACKSGTSHGHFPFENWLLVPFVWLWQRFEFAWSATRAGLCESGPIYVAFVNV